MRGGVKLTSVTYAVPPLIASADPHLIDEAMRWCAAVGVTPEVARGLRPVRRAWREAPFVILGADLVDGLLADRPPRRDHVLLVAAAPADLWPAAVELGASGVLAMHDEDGVIEAMTRALDGRSEACLVSLVGGSGGVGVSTLGVALALAGARRGLRSMVVDGDAAGPGLGLLMGAEASEGLQWHDLEVTRGRLSAGSLTEVLPANGGVSFLSWNADDRGPLPSSLPAVLAAAQRGFDLVVADVPRHLDEAGSDVVARSVLTVLVVAEEVCALQAASTVLTRLDRTAGTVAIATVTRSGGIGARAVSDALGRPVLVRHRHDRRIRGALDRGYGPGRSRSARRTGAVLLDALGLVAA